MSGLSQLPKAPRMKQLTVGAFTTTRRRGIRLLARYEGIPLKCQGRADNQTTGAAGKCTTKASEFSMNVSSE